MKKLKIIGIIGLIVGIVLLFIGKGLEAADENDGRLIFFLISGMAFSLIGAILLVIEENAETKRKKKEEKEGAAKALKISKEMVEAHYRDSIVNEIIYEYENGADGPLKEVIRNSAYEVDAGYNEKEDAFYMFIMKGDVGFFKVKNFFLLRLIKKNEEEIFSVNEEDIDISNLSKEELVAKIIEALTAHSPVQEKETLEFTITAPKFSFYIFLGLLVVSVVASIVLLGLYVAQILKVEALFGLLGASGFFLLISALGLWAYAREKFTLKDGVYTNRGLLKTQSCNARDVSKIVIQSANGLLFYVIFIGKNGESLMKCMDDGTMFRAGKFKRSLNYYGIEVKYE